MTVKDDLIAAKALIDAPDKWTKGIHFSGGRYCAMGAVGAATRQPHGGSRWAECDRALIKSAPRHRWREGVDGHPVVAFNDDPATTHADIMALFDRAIERASA
jgi:hypothetical protein